MKYIIMKAQEAREFEQLSGLTITKPFKHEPPYIDGAVLERTGYNDEWQLMAAHLIGYALRRIPCYQRDSKPVNGRRLYLCRKMQPGVSPWWGRLGRL